MSNLDVYCVSHFDEKQLFAHMGKLGLSLDPKDFATNGYQVDERQHPRPLEGRERQFRPLKMSLRRMKSRKRKTLLALGPCKV